MPHHALTLKDLENTARWRRWRAAFAVMAMAGLLAVLPVHAQSGPAQIEQVGRLSPAQQVNSAPLQVAASSGESQNGGQSASTVNISVEPSTGEAVTRQDVVDLWPIGSPFDGQPPGSGNQAAVYQDGSGHQATILQTGTGHTAVAVQEGANHTTTITQNGINHLAGIRLTGNGKAVNLTQNGAGHRYLLDMRGGSGATTDHQVVQSGQSNTLVQAGTISTPFNVRQSGSGMTMVIRHGTGGS